MFLTKRPEWCFLWPLEMNTTFSKLTKKHAPVNGWMAIVCQRTSRPFGVVGLKF
jgi:hypothetical protein